VRQLICVKADYPPLKQFDQPYKWSHTLASDFEKLGEQPEAGNVSFECIGVACMAK
jgi:hypothetical protein